MRSQVEFSRSRGFAAQFAVRRLCPKANLAIELYVLEQFQLEITYAQASSSADTVRERSAHEISGRTYSVPRVNVFSSLARLSPPSFSLSFLSSNCE